VRYARQIRRCRHNGRSPRLLRSAARGPV
jgi:hypothetical protein